MEGNIMGDGASAGALCPFILHPFISVLGQWSSNIVIEKETPSQLHFDWESQNKKRSLFDSTKNVHPFLFYSRFLSLVSLFLEADCTREN